jgi:hypothetical protein
MTDDGMQMDESDEHAINVYSPNFQTRQFRSNNTTETTELPEKQPPSRRSIVTGIVTSRDLSK